MAFSFPDDKKATTDALSDPQVGDRFTEMMNFWLYVARRDGNTVTTIEANGPCTLPQDGKVRVQTVKELQERLAYGGRPEKGYWVRLYDRDNDVDGWVSDEAPKGFDDPIQVITMKYEGAQCTWDNIHGALDELELWWDEKLEEEITFTIRIMSEADYNALPEFLGW